jgi:hypothetical protein
LLLSTVWPGIDTKDDRQAAVRLLAGTTYEPRDRRGLGEGVQRSELAGADVRAPLPDVGRQVFGPHTC